MAAATATGLGGYAAFIEPRGIRVERVDVRVHRLPSHLDGFTIGVLADVHVGPLVPVDYAKGAVEKLVALKPDLVVAPGDMTTTNSTAEAQRLIDEVFAPVKGAYAVLGNWDYAHHPVPVTIKPQTTLKLLVNQGVEAAPGLWLGGLDEGLFKDPDVDKAMTGAPEGAVRILLAHEPDLAHMVRPEHRVAVQISGHTHGGQVRLPFVGAPLLPPLGRKYVAGLYQAPACPVYVSRGVGLSNLPFRFLCPPEISLIRLRREGS